MDKIFRGILKYRTSYKELMVQKFIKVQNRPEFKAVFISCMDARLLPSQFTQTDVGEMFIVRNAGNAVPHADDSLPSTEPAALELGCRVNSISDVVVCGHSDCKAMQLLLSLKNSSNSIEKTSSSSPLRDWVARTGLRSLNRYSEFVENGNSAGCKYPLKVDSETSESDKLSLLHTLVQLENIESYGFIRELMDQNKVRLHALWFHISSGEVLYYSKSHQKFLVINEALINELKNQLL